MTRPRVAVALATAVVLAACSGGSGAESASSVTLPSSTTTEAPFATTVDQNATPTTTIPTFADGPLDEVCGETIVVQTSNFPDIGTGPLYALLGAAPSVAPDRQSVSAPLTRADGSVEAVTLEVRSGGPAVGFRSSVAVMAEDESIDVAISSTAVALRDRSVLETNAVVTLTDRSRDSVIIDPATHPDVTDLDSLGAQDIVVRHVTNAPVISFLEANGVLNNEQLQAGSDGLPASFVAADGAIAQQGDLTLEPALLPALTQWGRPVTALAAAASGWASLDDMLVVDAQTERLSDECLGRLVRVVQQSIVAYVADPGPTNAMMSEVRSQFNPLERLTPALLDAGTQLAIEAGVFDATRSDAPGSIVAGDLDPFLADLASALDVDPVTAEQLVDPRFVDSTISR